ncbi:adenosylcobinamide-GDP ribazoletransferase [Natrialbaceae archaeon A-CW2]|uniref:adenosylcobinamide-GDP ribazoletransferase n=1 Tax=Natronosalvus amylolyticus TaxID=2961994 RepID=UPI0020C94A08|nr:adenosylcobinamide-GDP ribazoletransferase [Natronosalvus amylolyticus]
MARRDGPIQRPLERGKTAIRGLRGAITFLTQLPVPRAGADASERDWNAFRTTPAAFPLVGWLVGGLTALVFVLGDGVPDATVAFGYLLAVYLVTGINHLDGVADVGDALVVHGDSERRRRVLKDTTTGVGALLAVGAVLIGVALAGFTLSGAPLLVAVAIVLAAEVGAKTGLALLACGGRAAHEGFGAQFTASLTPKKVVLPLAVGLPVIALSWPTPVAALTFVGALTGTALTWWWARRRLGGVTGDVFGAANEVSRLLGLHLGVIAWTCW